MTANDRVRELRKHLNLTQIEFAARFRLSQGHLTSVETGARAVTARFARMLNLECGVREEWILDGTGEMFDAGGDTFDEVARQLNLNEFQRRMVQLIYDMPIEHQRIIRDYAARLAADEAQLSETEHERIERITNDYLDAYDAQPPGLQTDKRA